MRSNFQQTLLSPVEVQGTGLHTGEIVRVRLVPAAPDSGICFVRADMPGCPEIPAHYSRVVHTQMATTLGMGAARVSTVEHLLAAIAGLHIDNLRIEVFGPELPILDGSAYGFFSAIESVGLERQAPRRHLVRLKRKVELRMGEKWAVAEPCSHLEIKGTVEWDHPAIGFQEYSYVEGVTPFTDLASARTFGFLRDVEALKRMGLIKGGSLENAVVLDAACVLNPEGLRFKDEFARHKVLDALGDFKLAGVAMQMSVRLHRAGHDLHQQLLAEIFKNAENFEPVDPSESREREERRRAALAVAANAAYV